MPSLATKKPHVSNALRSAAELGETSAPQSRATLRLHLEQHIQQNIRTELDSLGLLILGQDEKIKDEIKIHVKTELKAELLLELPELFKRQYVPRDEHDQPLASLSSNDACQKQRSSHLSRNFRSRAWGSNGTKYASGLDQLFGDIPRTSEGIPILNVEAHESLAQDMGYDFCDTVWDIMPFLGLGVLLRLDQACAVLLMLLNIGIQGLFIGVLWSMMNNEFSSDQIVRVLQDWRILYAHNPDFADTFTNTPLAKSVCEGSMLMMEGAQQGRMYAEMKDYMMPFWGIARGGMVCMLAELLWLLTCAKELERMLAFFIGIWTPADDQVSSTVGTGRCPSHVQILDKPLIWLHGEATQKNYQIVVTRQRALVLTIVSLLPRAAILVALGYAGSMFLIQTTELSDLVINAVALDIVLHVDEMLFDMFAPLSACRIVRKTMPLRIPRSRVRGRISPWLNIALVAAILLVVGHVFLHPMICRMRDAMNVMCAGDQSFVAAQMSYGPVVSGLLPRSEIPHGSYAYRAIHQRTGLQRSVGNLQHYLEGDKFTFSHVRAIKSWKERSVQEEAELSVSDPQSHACIDVTHSEWRTAFLLGIGSRLGNSSFRSCRDVKDHCYNDTSERGKIARLVCPVTCGAVDPQSGLFLVSSVDGVPRRCRDATVVRFAQRSCNDRKTNILRNSKAWRRYADGAVAHLDKLFLQLSSIPQQTVDSVNVTPYHEQKNRLRNGLSSIPQQTVDSVNVTHYHEQRNRLWNGMLAHGCNFFRGPISFKYLRPPQYTLWFDFCDMSSALLKGRRSVRVFCPVTCRCDREVKKHYANLLNLSSFQIGTLVDLECPFSCLRP